ncbi:hypothetical protein PR048_012580 [Dryococelus australis]|uniref:Uncharacterized protein n=1 Tax=Dryococelus australis TaxID=614101 RepID=A0ABQ9HPT3_9NEOP|nr:hypothetical protein PR048_012580 [Dryococelus australis]
MVTENIRVRKDQMKYMLPDYMTHFRQDEIKTKQEWTMTLSIYCLVHVLKLYDEVTHICKILTIFFNRPKYNYHNIRRFTSGLGCYLYCEETSESILSPCNEI